MRVGGFATALGSFVVPALHELAVSDPALQVQVVEVDAQEGVALLRAGDLDLLLGERYFEATATHRGPHPGLVEDDLRRDPFRIVVPRMWAVPETVEELLAGAWVSTRRHVVRDVLDRLADRHGVTTGHRHHCTDARTMLALVAAGLGAAIIPELTLSYLPSEGVQPVGTALDLGARVLTVIGPEHQHRSAATQRFHRLIREIASREAFSAVSNV